MSQLLWAEKSSPLRDSNRLSNGWEPSKDPVVVAQAQREMQ